MANLKKGSTVGGFAIISDGNKNSHIHDVSDIDGLGTAATANTGPGSGFDADTLNGQHFSDIQNSFVNISGDSIQQNVSLSGSPINNLDAINKKYVLDYIEDELILGSNSIPFVSISQTNNLSYDISTETVSFNSNDILIGGKYFSFSPLSTSLTPVASSTRYIYVILTGNTITLEVENVPISHNFQKILVGSVSFTPTATVDQIDKRTSMTNLGSHSISTNPIRNSAILSDSSGDIDSEWFDISFGSAVNTVTLKGDTTVNSGGSTTYTITDYDQLSTYSVNTTLGGISINGDQIVFNAPTTTNLEIVTLVVTRNSTSIPFEIGVIP